MELFSIACFVFWLWMFIDCLMRDFRPGEGRKLWWGLGIFFIPFVNLVYFIMVWLPAKRREREERGQNQGNNP